MAPLPAPSSLGRNATKINPPAVGEAVLAPRLADRLAIGLVRPLVWIHATPGAGKTTLVARFCEERRISPIWLRLDPDDGDPATFFVHAGLAAARVDPSYPSRLPGVRPEYLRDASAFSRRFFRALFDAADPVLLVVDDYHELELGSQIHRCLADGFAEIPIDGHVVVISRAPPPMEFASARLRGLVDVLPPHALCLTVAEAGAIAGRRSLKLSDGQLETFVDNAQGWAAGIVLMMEAARPGGTDLMGAGRDVPELLFDYFASEVFFRLEDRARRSLTILALLPSVPAAVVGFLTEDATAIELIDDLAKRNYFTAGFEEPEESYRFHPLFRAFLLRRFETSFDASAKARLKGRAASALERASEIEDAVAIYHELEAWDELVGLVLKWAPLTIERGLHSSVLGWIDRLPSTQVDSFGWLTFWRASALFATSPRQSRPLFEAAFSRFRDAGDVSGMLLSWAGRANAVTEDPGSSQAILDVDIALLQEIMRDVAAFPSPVVEFRVALAMYLALVRRSNDRDTIATWRARALASAAALGKPGLPILIRYYITLYALIDGDYATVREQIEAVPPPEALGREPLLQQVAHVAIGLGQLFGQLPGRCEETAERALAISKETGIYLWSHFQAGFEAIAENDLPKARKWVRRTAQLTGKVAVYHSAHYQIMAAAAALLAGDVDGSIRSGRIAVDMTTADGWFLYEAMARVSLAQALDCAGQDVAADVELAASEAAANRIAASSIKISINFLRADFLLQRGRDAEGLAALAAAMEWGERTGGRRTMLTPIRNSRLCARALRENIRPSYAQLLIRASNLPPPDRTLEAWPWPLKILTFGTFGIFQNGEQLPLSRKTPRRLLTLLKAIIAFGGTNVSETKLMDALWPEEDGDAAKSSLDVAIHRLRKLIGNSQALFVKDGRVSLDPASCWLDVWAFEAMSRAGHLERGRLLAIYKGPFLADDEDDWIAPRRAQLAATFAKACGP